MRSLPCRSAPGGRAWLAAGLGPADLCCFAQTGRSARQAHRVGAQFQHVTRRPGGGQGPWQRISPPCWPMSWRLLKAICRVVGAQQSQECSRQELTDLGIVPPERMRPQRARYRARYIVPRHGELLTTPNVEEHKLRQQISACSAFGTRSSRWKTKDYVADRHPVSRQQHR